MQSRIKPTANQLAFLDWEFGVFFHFGIRTFFKGHKDWDGREMPAAAFQPVALDCDQWIRTGKAAGAHYAILTAKHHDGFCNWPSAYTAYSVKNTPWRDGKGDVVAEYVAACRKYGLKVGLYYSPAQWGDGADFGDAQAYDDYFIGQLTELLTGYGRIDYLWFDGNGSGGHQYDKARIIAAIRRMQPDILIFEMWDPDTRWARNEDGYAEMPNPYAVEETDYTQIACPSGKFDMPRFLPVECDFTMRHRTWFDCEDNEETVKSVDELMGIYELSVGRGANFLIGIGPDVQGSLPAADTARLLAFGDAVRSQYGTPLPGFGAVSGEGSAWCIEADESALVNRLVISEDLSEGEAVRAFRIYGEPMTAPGRRICLYKGDTIGHKAICLFPAMRTRRLVLEITEHDGPVRISGMTACFAGQTPDIDTHA